MLDQAEIADQIARNCAVSDARYAGCYSVCGLALRLRDLYKWEKGLAPCSRCHCHRLRTEQMPCSKAGFHLSGGQGEERYGLD